jgi:hypothetical protein
VAGAARLRRDVARLRYLDRPPGDAVLDDDRLPDGERQPTGTGGTADQERDN